MVRVECPGCVCECCECVCIVSWTSSSVWVVDSVLTLEQGSVHGLNITAHGSLELVEFGCVCVCVCVSSQEGATVVPHVQLAPCTCMLSMCSKQNLFPRISK